MARFFNTAGVCEPEDHYMLPPEARLPEVGTLRCPRPVVLFLDEIDALFGQTLLTVLHQLRAGYRSRPKNFPHAVTLIGLRDVRDYKVRETPEIADPVVRELEELLGTSSPFNIKVESLSLRNFTSEEVGELYAQHTSETGQTFTTEATELAYRHSVRTTADRARWCANSP